MSEETGEAKPATAAADQIVPKAERILVGRFLRRDSPYIAMLFLALVGVAYASYSGQPILLYWGILAPVFGAICVAVGWRRESDPKQRWRLVWTQASHWVAVVVVMYLILIPQSRGAVSNSAVGLNLMSLLALGTFTSGVHSRAWGSCVVGGALALAIPAIASIEQFTLLIFVIAAVVFGVGVLFWWLMDNHAAAE